ncbi:MAG: CBS domain-containing protein [Sedimentisphaerales bacterium]
MVTSQTEEKAKAEAAETPKAEAEEKTNVVEEKTEAKVEAAEEPKAETEEKAKPEVEAKPETEAKTEAVEKKDKPEVEAKVEAEEKAENEPEAKPKSEAAETPKAEAEEKTNVVEEKTEAKVEAAEKPKAEAEKKDEAKEKTETEPEEKTETEEKTTAPDQSQEPAKGGVSETIQKMTQSPAILPGESGKSSTAHISVPSTVCAKDVMQKDVVWAGPDESVQQALTKMQQNDSGYIMIGQDGKLEGIVSKSDITGATSIYLRPIFAKWHGPSDDATLQIKLKWIMSRPVRTIRPQASLTTIIENMCRFGGRSLPVADEQGKVQGLVTVFDIFRTLLNTSEDVSAVGKTAEAPALE